ncbi:hypothetical protein B0D95_11190 [Cellvibrio sp. PSBB023]|nr:hypothetical protein B0D95_11190 [Cellvibrio sp. PSBB023]
MQRLLQQHYFNHIAPCAGTAEMNNVQRVALANKQLIVRNNIFIHRGRECLPRKAGHCDQ